MRILLLCCVCLTTTVLQAADTLRFHSTAFGAAREVVVHLPEFHAAASEKVRMPVFIVLDGQHDWFVEPVLNDIRFLQYTHQVPQAITVVVPHADRVKESAELGNEAVELPLLRMLADELPPLLQRYHPGDHVVLIGHSFTASFALYAKQFRPQAFDAVIALSPLHRVEHYLPALEEQLRTRPHDEVLLAVGGSAPRKDGGHHTGLVPVWEKLSADMGHMSLREYPSASHTSLPVVALPELLSMHFNAFALRDSLAPVDQEYQLLQKPGTPEAELAKVRASLRFRGTELPWEVAEINGLASRYEASGYVDHVRAIYRWGVELYPGDISIQWYLGEALLPVDRPAALQALRKAMDLLDHATLPAAEKAEARAAIEELMQ